MGIVEGRAARTFRRHRVGVVLASLGAVVLAQSWAPDSGAQSCDRACEARLRDAHGCCPAPAAAPRPGPATPARTECVDGKEVSPDTMGHCCWAGQVWTSGRCVGPPSSCPSPRTLDTKAQECVVPHCPTGMSRTDDRVHCCWPGQGWSVTRDRCIGNPQCPRDFEVESEGCVSQDKDGDGIPNAQDKCPDEPEDRNGFEDDDGCPDEARRVAAAAAAANAAQQAAAERAQQQSQADEEQRRQAAAAAEAEQARAREIEARRAAAEQAARNQAAAAEQAKRDRQAADARAATRRTLGLVLTGVGLASGIGSFVFMALGSGENGSISGGSLPSGNAIAAAASSGATDNTAAIVLGAVGILGCGAGIPLFVSGLGGSADKPETPAPAVSIVPTVHGASVTAAIRFE